MLYVIVASSLDRSYLEFYCLALKTHLVRLLLVVEVSFLQVSGHLRQQIICLGLNLIEQPLPTQFTYLIFELVHL